jgi:hypothetical protein
MKTYMSMCTISRPDPVLFWRSTIVFTHCLLWAVALFVLEALGERLLGSPATRSRTYSRLSDHSESRTD